MKQMLSLLLALALCLPLCACENEQEKANRAIEEANQAYEREQKNLMIWKENWKKFKDK